MVILCLTVDHSFKWMNEFIQKAEFYSLELLTWEDSNGFDVLKHNLNNFLRFGIGFNEYNLLNDPLYTSKITE